MEEKTVFISSCSRRELARRRPYRTPVSLQVLLLAVVVAIALGALVTAHGGL